MAKNWNCLKGIEIEILFKIRETFMTTMILSNHKKSTAFNQTYMVM